MNYSNTGFKNKREIHITSICTDVRLEYSIKYYYDTEKISYTLGLSITRNFILFPKSYLYY